jgi:hypothetical protein
MQTLLPSSINLHFSSLSDRPSAPRKASSKRDKKTIIEGRKIAKLNLDNFYCLLIKNAIVAQIEEYGSWKWDVSAGKLDDAIAKKYSVQFKDFEIDAHGQLQLEFELIGEICSILENFSMYTTVKAVMLNSAAGINGAIKEPDLQNLRVLFTDLWNSVDIYSKEEFEDVYRSVTKPYPFLLSDLSRYQN